MTRIITIAAAAFFLLASPASARSYDAGWESESMRRAAYELERAAERLTHSVAKKVRRPGRRERGALIALHEFAERAEKFRERIDRYERRPDKLRREYDRLHAAFEHAEHCFGELRVGRHAYRELSRVTRLVYRLGDRVETVLIAKRQRRQERYEVAYHAPWYWWEAYFRY